MGVLNMNINQLITWEPFALFVFFQGVLFFTCGTLDVFNIHPHERFWFLDIAFGNIWSMIFGFLLIFIGLFVCYVF